MDKLFKYRDKAIQNGVISKSLKKYFKGIMIYKKEEIPIKIRLKGDWIDHLNGSKWSFRIKILGDKDFKGMKAFSIQHPKTRSFLKEWIMHKIFKDENILTTRYGFITSSLNGNNLGIYNLEEQHSKELLFQKKLDNSVRLIGISVSNLNSLTNEKKLSTKQNISFQLKFEF